MKLDSSQHYAQSSSPRTSRLVWHEWILAAFMLALIALAGFSSASSWGGDAAWRYVAIAVLSGALAALFGKSRGQDSMAMLTGVLAGVVAVWIVNAASTSLLEGAFYQRLKATPKPLWDALWHKDLTGVNRDLSTEILLGLTIWMSAWISMWVLVRINMVTVALIPPCTLILVNEFIANRTNGWAPIAMVGLSLVIIVLSRYEARAGSWRVSGLASSDSVMARVLTAGLVLAVVVSSTMAMSPAAWSQTVLEPLISNITKRVQDARLEAQYWFDDVLGTSSAPPRMGNYTNFSDGFSIGGPINLTDQPEVTAQIATSQAPYLTARTYDHYTGRGWSSSSAGIFADTDGSARQSPELLYNPNWEVAISPQVRSNRIEQTALITPLAGSPDVVYRVDTYLSSNVQTVVRMSWTTVDSEPLSVTAATLNSLPPDLQLISSLLLQADLTGQATAWGPSATSGSIQAAIEEEVDDLARRGIEVQWVATSDGIVQTLFVSGRLPVFDDVEGVFQRQPTASGNTSYRTTGLTSTASAEQLASAGTAYPAWVTERYLGTGDSVTDRTEAFAQELVGEETNPYQQALILESWLRSNIVYDDQVNAPPGDQDLVDYVLFDNQRGYCEHYSAAMTVMLRSLGVPSRVVVGYSPGEWDADAGAFVYRQNNAHAWVEVYFPGYGWIPFEPTANRPLGEFDAQPIREGESPGVQDTVSTPEPTLAPTEPVVPTPDPSDDNTEATPLPTSDDSDAWPPVVIEDAGGGPPGWVRPVAIVAAAVSAISLIGYGVWMWGLRGLSPTAGLMRRVQRVGRWIGIRQGPTTTPRELTRRFEREVPAVSPAVRRITKAYEIETFGATGVAKTVSDDAGAAWQEIRRRIVHLWRSKRRRRKG